MPKFSRQHLTIAAATAAAAIGGTQIAGAADTTTAAGPAASQQRPDGHRGPGFDTAAIAKALGVTEAKLQAALAAARPDDAGARPDRRADEAAALASALGVETSAVQKILDANRPKPPSGAKPAGAKPRGGGPRPDDTALVSALAKGLSTSEADVKAAVAKVRAAHEADHAARETALYAAVAKALGQDAADVQQAFEAARPAR